MKLFKKIFFETKMSWKFVIIYAIACGVITGIIPLIPILDETSIYNIAVCYEMWIFLALVIILNCEKPLEAGLKTFVFFLISQPLVYLVQVPFYDGGFEIFKYYTFWAKMTILTFPGAMIAWYTKKGNLISELILAVALFILTGELVVHFSEMLKHFPKQILAVVFIVFELVLFITLLFKEKKSRIRLLIAILLFVGITFFLQNRTPSIEYRSVCELEENKTYTVVEKDPAVTIDINGTTIVTIAKSTGDFNFALEDNEGNIKHYTYHVVENDSCIILLD